MTLQTSWVMTAHEGTAAQLRCERVVISTVTQTQLPVRSVSFCCSTDHTECTQYTHTQSMMISFEGLLLISDVRVVPLKSHRSDTWGNCLISPKSQIIWWVIEDSITATATEGGKKWGFTALMNSLQVMCGSTPESCTCSKSNISTHMINRQTTWISNMSSLWSDSVWGVEVEGCMKLHFVSICSTNADMMHRRRRGSRFLPQRVPLLKCK